MKSCLYYISVLFFFASALIGQNQLQNQFNYAKSLFENQQYFDAITEYKRVLFFNSSAVSHFTVYFKIGESYKAGSKFDDAIKFFSLAELNASNDEELFETKTQIIRTNILRKTTERALQLCDELEKEARFKNKIEEINYWRGWAYMFADDWKSAAKCFSLINIHHELKLLSENTERVKVSVTFAKVISYILPGAGAIYSGNFLSGLMSLGWNALAGFWTINSFIEQRAFDGIVVGELVWLRFYRGAIQNAEDFAIEKNLKTANKSLRFLQNEYKGIKP